MRVDDFVDITAARSHERIGEAGFVLLGLVGDLLRIVTVLSENDFHRTLCAHHRDFGCRPCVVQIAAQVLRCHHVVCAAISLARDHGYLGHCRFGIGEQQLRPMLDDAVVLLAGPGKKTGHIDESQYGDFESVAKTNETRSLLGRIDVEHARQYHRLVRNHAHRASFHPAETADDIACMGGLNLEEVAFVQRLSDDFVHVIRLISVIGDQRIEAWLFAIPGIAGRPLGHILAV